MFIYVLFNCKLFILFVIWFDVYEIYLIEGGVNGFCGCDFGEFVIFVGIIVC